MLFRSATTLPPISNAPPTYSVPGTTAAPYNPYAPTFRPSTAPASSSSFNQIYSSWMDWLTGAPTTTFGAPTGYGAPASYGAPTTYSAPPTYAAPPTYGGAPAPNPYGNSPSFANPFGTTAPSTYGAPAPGYAGGPTLNGGYPNPYSNPYPSNPYGNGVPPNMGGYPSSGNPWAGYPGSGYPATGYPGGGYPGAQYPYPNSWNAWWYNTSSAVQTQTQQTMRLCQGLRFRYTYVPGNTNFGGVEGDQIESHDFETSLVFAIPRFFGMSQPWYLMPSYVQHLWSGPETPGSDLPG